MNHGQTIHGPETSENSTSLALWLKSAFGLTLCAIVALIVLRSLPGLDHAFSNLFFTNEACPSGEGGSVCGVFALSISPLWNIVRSIGYEIPRVAAVLLLIYLLYLLAGNRNTSTETIRAPLVGILSFVAGPLIATNVILKEWWGRPRPFQTGDFGGTGTFVSPGTVSDQCAANCSFVSGEASSAFWMLWIVPFLPAKYRWPAGLSLFVLASAISVFRVAFGRHYLSDIVMSALITLSIVAWTGVLVFALERRGILDSFAHKSNRFAANLRRGFKNLFDQAKRNG